MRHALIALLVSAALPAFAAENHEAEARKVAQAYLQAITGQGNDDNRALLLGGVTMTAQMFSIENGEIVSVDPVRTEHGDLGHAVQMMNDLDKAGRKALAALLRSTGSGDDMSVTELTQAQAQGIMKPTKEKATRFKAAHPLLAYIARVDKEVYWHPKNPVRPLLSQAGISGSYDLEFHNFWVETKEGPRQVARRWKLRVLRFKGGAVDTGWKVLPAADWNGE